MVVADTFIPFARQAGHTAPVPRTSLVAIPQSPCHVAA